MSCLLDKSPKRLFTVLLNACLVLFALTLPGCNYFEKSGWTTYRHDKSRSGITKERIKPPLYPKWIFKPAHAPQPAWYTPAEERPRMHEDNTFHVVAANGLAYWGSSVDNKIYAIDISTGAVVWSYFTEGPIRFAPTINKDRVFLGSDDGHVYCLDAKTGLLEWRYKAGPGDDKVLGNGRMVSLWPVRTSVVVEEDIVYFGAGVFPYEGLYVCALDANDGSIIWKNDTLGDQEHELNFGGISPHGYLVTSKDMLYVPSGRAMPAVLDKKNGQFIRYLSPPGKVGGSWTVLDDENVVAGIDYSGTPSKQFYNDVTGQRIEDIHAWFPSIDLLLKSNVSFALTGKGIVCLERKNITNIQKELNSCKGKKRNLAATISELRRKIMKIPKDRDALQDAIDKNLAEIERITEKEQQLKSSLCKWEYLNGDLTRLILAGDVAFAGGRDHVVAVNAKSGEELWKAPIASQTCGLAATKGHLFVSTSTGDIYCYSEEQTREVQEIKCNVSSSPYVKDDKTPIYAEAAETILSESGVQKGYALVLDAGIGRLAYELAKKSDLKIIGIEEDPEKIREAKEKLDAAGLYGSRVVIEPWDLKSLPDYFANLIVSDENIRSRKNIQVTADIARVLKPSGGVALFSKALKSQPGLVISDKQLIGSDNSLKMITVSDKKDALWTKITRGELEGAGSWTQQYGNPQNTACSNDELVNGPLGVLWWGEPGPAGMMERHARGMSPVSIDGRMFIEGQEKIMAYDAFNGTLLWKRDIPGAVRVKIKGDAGNLALTHDALYVAAYDKCYKLEPATGKTLHVFTLPPSADGKPRRWGYISCTGTILYGSAAIQWKEDYAAIIKECVENGKWKDVSEINPLFVERYKYYKNLYPVPDENFLWDLQRAGMLYRTMTKFPGGGEFTNQNAITDGLQVSDKIFAMNAETGKLLWQYDGGKIANITIALGDNKIFFADSKVSDSQKQRAFEIRHANTRSGKYEIREGIFEEADVAQKNLEKIKNDKNSTSRAIERAEYVVNAIKAELFREESNGGTLEYKDADVRNVFALNARTGAKIWNKPVDLTGCCGDKMGAAFADGLLLFFGNHGNHDAWRFKADALKWRRIMALNADKGNMLWSKALNYRTRPLIVGDQIIIEPRACNLYTGEIIMRTHPVTGEQVPWEFLRPGHTCAITSASANGLYYRSSCTAFYDLENDRGVTQFGAIRPGCAINLIPANGVLLFPEASSGCTCSYPLRTSLVLKQKPNRPQPWTVFITHGDMTPVKHFAINLGAPSDMRDDDGILWFGYPNPKTVYSKNHFPNYGVKFDLKEETLPDMGYFCSDFRNSSIKETDKPWLFTSGCVGLSRCEIPLIDKDKGQESALYTIRCGFNAPSQDQKGNRIFDVQLQGDVVMSDFDIVSEAGSTNKAVVKEFKGIQVKDDLVIELASKKGKPKKNQAPIINFIEIIREDVI